MKKCRKCGVSKDFCEFYKNKGSKDGVTNECRDCALLRIRRKSRTMDGLISVIYNRQKRSSLRRGHQEPAYTLDELREWALSQDLFYELYTNWVNSNYDTWLVPSFDRLNNNEGYSFNNIQIVTWRENLDNFRVGIKRGAESRQCRPVAQMYSDGGYIAKYFSIRGASRATGIKHPDIIAVCKGEMRLAGGYKWEYTTW